MKWIECIAPSFLCLLAAVPFALADQGDSTSQQSVSLEAVYGSDNPICRKAINFASKISRDDFLNDNWSKSFKAIELHHSTHESVDKSGKHWTWTFNYLPVDIYNDGSQEIVVVETYFFSSIDWDHLFVLSPEVFRDSLKKNVIDKVIQQSPELNPYNEVQFSNGKELFKSPNLAVPVKIHFWNQGNRNYLLLKDNRFASGEEPSDSLYVASLSRQSPKPDMRGKQQLVADLVCLIRERTD